MYGEPPAHLRPPQGNLEEDVTALLLPVRNLSQIFGRGKESARKTWCRRQGESPAGFIIDTTFWGFRKMWGQLRTCIVTGSSRARGPLQHYIMGM